MTARRSRRGVPRSHRRPGSQPVQAPGRRPIADFAGRPAARRSRLIAPRRSSGTDRRSRRTSRRPDAAAHDDAGMPGQALRVERTIASFAAGLRRWIPARSRPACVRMAARSSRTSLVVPGRAYATIRAIQPGPARRVRADRSQACRPSGAAGSRLMRLRLLVAGTTAARSRRRHFVPGGARDDPGSGRVGKRLVGLASQPRRRARPQLAPGIDATAAPSRIACGRIAPNHSAVPGGRSDDPGSSRGKRPVRLTDREPRRRCAG